MVLQPEDVSKLKARFEGLVGHQVSRLKTDAIIPTWNNAATVHVPVPTAVVAACSGANSKPKVLPMARYQQINTNAISCRDQKTLRGLPCAAQNLKALLQLLVTTLREVTSSHEVLTHGKALLVEQERRQCFCAIHRKALALENQLHQYVNPGLVTSLNRRSAKATCEAEMIGKFINKLRRESRMAACNPENKIRACEMVIKLKSMLVRQKCEWQCVGRLKETVTVAKEMRDVLKFVCQLSCLLGASDNLSCPSLGMTNSNFGDLPLDPSPTELTISLSWDLGQDEADDNDCDRRRQKKADRSSRRPQERGYSHLDSPQRSRSGSDVLSHREDFGQSKSYLPRRPDSQPPPASRFKGERRTLRPTRRQDNEVSEREECPRSKTTTHTTTTGGKYGHSRTLCSCCQMEERQLESRRDDGCKRDEEDSSPKRRITISTQCPGKSDESRNRKRQSSRSGKKSHRESRDHETESPRDSSRKSHKGSKKNDIVRRLAEESAAEARRRNGSKRKTSSGKSTRDGSGRSSRHSSKRKGKTSGGGHSSPAAPGETRPSKEERKSGQTSSGAHSHITSSSHRSRGASSKSFRKSFLSDIEESVRENSVKKSKDDDSRRKKTRDDGKGKSSDSRKSKRHSSSRRTTEYQNVQNSACCNVIVEKSSSSLGDYLAISWSQSSCDLSGATQILSDSDCGVCQAMADCPCRQRSHEPSANPCSNRAIDIFMPCGNDGSSDSFELSAGESQQPLIISSHETEVSFDGQDAFTLRTREVEALHPSTCTCLICRTGNNNYLRCGQVVKSVGIWASDATTTCLERQLAVCLQEEEDPCHDGPTRGAKYTDSRGLPGPCQGRSEVCVDGEARRTKGISHGPPGPCQGRSEVCVDGEARRTKGVSRGPPGPCQGRSEAYLDGEARRTKGVSHGPPGPCQGRSEGFVDGETRRTRGIADDPLGSYRCTGKAYGDWASRRASTRDSYGPPMPCKDSGEARDDGTTRETGKRDSHSPPLMFSKGGSGASQVTYDDHLRSRSSASECPPVETDEAEEAHDIKEEIDDTENTFSETASIKSELNPSERDGNDEEEDTMNIKQEIMDDDDMSARTHSSRCSTRTPSKDGTPSQQQLSPQKSSATSSRKSSADSSRVGSSGKSSEASSEQSSSASSRKSSAVPSGQSSTASSRKSSAASSRKSSAAPSTQSSAVPSVQSSAAPSRKSSAAPSSKSSVAFSKKSSAASEMSGEIHDQEAGSVQRSKATSESSMADRRPSSQPPPTPESIISRRESTSVIKVESSGQSSLARVSPKGEDRSMSVREQDQEEEEVIGVDDTPWYMTEKGRSEFFRKWRWFLLGLLLNLYLFHVLWCLVRGPECLTCSPLFPTFFMNLINMATRSVRLVHYSPAPF